MIELSEATKNRIVLLFDETEQGAATHILLNECGDNIGGVKTAYTELAERVRFAVLKLSNGDLAVLSQQAREAGKDFRDVLMAAGFGESIQAHLDWVPGNAVGA